MAYLLVLSQLSGWVIGEFINILYKVNDEELSEEERF